MIICCCCFYAGACGSCWAFSAIGAIEGAHAIKTSNLESLSEQQIIDCTYADTGLKGCDGDWMNDAIHFLIANGGSF